RWRACPLVPSFPTRRSSDLKMSDAALDVLSWIEGRAHAEGGRRRRHELHQSSGPSAGDGARVELRLGLDDRRNQVLRKTVSGGQFPDVGLDPDVEVGPDVKSDSRAALCA